MFNFNRIEDENILANHTDKKGNILMIRIARNINLIIIYNSEYVDNFQYLFCLFITGLINISQQFHN